MAITVDELQAIAKSGDTELTSKLEGISKAINSSGHFHPEWEGMKKAINSSGCFRPDLDGMMKAINGSSYFASQLDGIRKSLNNSFAFAKSARLLWPTWFRQLLIFVGRYSPPLS